MRVITLKRLRDFWASPNRANAEKPLRAWYRVVVKATWQSFGDVRKVFNSVDQVGSKTVFDVGGNKFRIIAFIDYEGQRVFLRAVLDHAEYDTGDWKKDAFGDNWKPYREFKTRSARKNRRDKP